MHYFHELCSLPLRFVCTERATSSGSLSTRRRRQALRRTCLGGRERERVSRGTVKLESRSKQESNESFNVFIRLLLPRWHGGRLAKLNGAQSRCLSFLCHRLPKHQIPGIREENCCFVDRNFAPNIAWMYICSRRRNPDCGG